MIDHLKTYYIPHMIVLFVTISLLLTACVPEGLMRTWSSSEEYDHQFQNLMVMGLINNVAIRNDAETEVVVAARQTGLKASKGIVMFPPELGKPFEDIERVKTRLRENGFDGILTVALIDVRAPRNVSPELVYEPLVYYDRFRNYYYRTYELVYQPGYITEDAKYFIETNFYELKGGKLVWSGRSMMFQQSELYSYLPNYARGLFKELALQEIIQK